MALDMSWNRIARLKSYIVSQRVFYEESISTETKTGRIYKSKQRIKETP